MRMLTIGLTVAVEGGAYETASYVITRCANASDGSGRRLHEGQEEVLTKM